MKHQTRDSYTKLFHDEPLLLAIGLTAACGQMLLTYSYRLGLAVEVSIYNYMGLPISLALGFLLWQEVPDIWSLSGMALIVSAGFWAYWGNWGNGAGGFGSKKEKL